MLLLLALVHLNHCLILLVRVYIAGSTAVLLVATRSRFRLRLRLDIVHPKAVLPG